MITIDRIEGEWAILDIEGETVQVRLALLPAGVVEGQALSFVARDVAEASPALLEAEARLARLKASSPQDAGPIDL